MLLSAVSVLDVAQSIFEIPEGLMNNPVLGAVSQFKYDYQNCRVLISRVHRLGFLHTPSLVPYNGPNTAELPLIFFGTFAKLRKSDLASSCMALCLSAKNDSAPTGRIFMKFDTFSIF